MTKYFIILISFFCSMISFGQQGWDWGSDKQLSQQKWFNVVEKVKKKDYEVIRSDVNWLLTNTPKLNVDLYKQASLVYQAIEKKINTTSDKKTLQDSALWVYDTRLAYFGDSANVLNRKGLYAYKYKASDVSYYSELFNLYSQIFKLNGYKTYMNNTLFFIATASTVFKQNKIEEKEFISIYNQLIAYSDDHILKAQSQKSKQNYKNTKSKIEDVFAQTITMTCDKIQDLYGDEMKKDSLDLVLVKKVYFLLSKSKCLNSELYGKVLMLVNDAQPSTNGYIGLAEYYDFKKDDAKVDEMYAKALSLTTSKPQKGEVYFELAKRAKASKRFLKAREYALKTISSGVHENEAYTMIGDLYMYNSYEKCKTTDAVISRGVYLAAFNMYEKAGNKSKMELAQKQFPSDQEIFFTNRKIGQTIQTGCWVGQSVVIRKR